jgi:hypothetical protein
VQALRQQPVRARSARGGGRAAFAIELRCAFPQRRGRGCGGCAPPRVARPQVHGGGSATAIDGIRSPQRRASHQQSPLASLAPRRSPSVRSAISRPRLRQAPVCVGISARYLGISAASCSAGPRASARLGRQRVAMTRRRGDGMKKKKKGPPVWEQRGGPS